MVKGQSALEYMMTYGWAILIIVIVAVILYSMGIFNPRASVTAASSGFSPFAASAAICNSTATYISFIVGGLPGSATSASITGFYLSGLTGFSTGTPSSTNVYSSSSTDVSTGSTFLITVPDATCSTSGVSFSASGALTYSYSTAAGKVTTNATGTIAGTSS